MADDFEIGDLVETFATFTDPAGAPFDPDAVFFRVKDAAGAVTTLEYGVDAGLLNLGPGSYQANIDATAAGAYRYRWFSTGDGQASESSGFTVRTPKTE